MRLLALGSVVMIAWAASSAFGLIASGSLAQMTPAVLVIVGFCFGREALSEVARERGARQLPDLREVYPPSPF